MPALKREAALGAPWLLALALLLLSPPFGSALGEALSFVGETRIVSQGSHFGRFDLAVDSTLTFIDVSTVAGNALIKLTGPRGLWLMRNHERWIGEGPGSVDVALPMGRYFVYIVSSPEQEIVVTLRLSNLTGSREYRLVDATSSSFADLDSGVIPSTSGTGLHRFQGVQPFPGTVYSGMVIRETVDGSEEHHREYRWSNADGIHWCLAEEGGSVGVGIINIWIVTMWDGDHRLPLNLTYFRDSVALMTYSSAKGYWVERAPDDAPYPYPPPLQPIGWDLLESNEPLDKDVMCLAPFSTYLVAQVVGTLP